MSMSSSTPAVEAAQPSEAVLEVAHLRKDFPLRSFNPFAGPQAVHAVQDFSLALYPGRATALVGESGSGKSTVARMLARLYAPTTGEVRFRGQPIKFGGGIQSQRAYRRHVQMVFQDPFSSLNPMHTVRYHLSRPLRIYGHVRNNDEETEQVLSLLERVSLTPTEQFIEKYPHQLSGGQRQRVAIARALAVQPEILLADEPVSMLDVSIRLDILNLMLRLKDEEQLAVLFITHDIASARYFAEETVVMYAGQQVEGGDSDDVIQNPLHPYTRLLISAAPDPDKIGGLQDNESDKPIEIQTVTTEPARSEPPSLIRPPTGCRFHTRCPHVMPQCREKFPPRTMVKPGHWTHCYLYS